MVKCLWKQQASCLARGLSVYHHDGGDDGDEGIAVGQQPVGGLGAAVGVSAGRSDAVQERGGGRVTPRFFLLHLLLDVVFYNLALVVSLHPGGATAPRVTQRDPRTLPADCLQTVAVS